ncbi:SRPBCC family protein [Desertibacillus haloalkaliphilus]|uniref:SRPBCC family protein n=1 Tax=Desertibacillus haloalkaliphilus TaxID=1328930 RepID=UPI001C271E97|nr:SRPBCC domain-containing protein [Desertibacillus haloalkaliphilus]MBU8907614.1 SRPBCC domain-containing protein [Desertibacillus haloalkaliphilus]
MTEQAVTPEIRKQIVYNADVETVWNAVATAEGIESWFMANDFQPEVGATFTLQSPFGPSPCQVTELQSPTHLSFSWGEAGWQLTFELEDVDGKAQLTLIHAGWGKPDEIIPGPSQTNLEVRNRMSGGWDSLLEKDLRSVVER